MILIDLMIVATRDCRDSKLQEQVLKAATNGNADVYGALYLNIFVFLERKNLGGKIVRI